MSIPESVQATALLAAAGRAGIDPFASLFLGSMSEADQALARTGQAELEARTKLIDAMLLAALKPGLTVVSLGAGLCARPYRLDLSACHEVIEVDAEPVLALKEKALSGHLPSCPVRRIAGDVRDLPPLPASAVVISEGLLVYLSPEELARLAATLPRGCEWLADIVSSHTAQAMCALAGGSLRLSGLDSLSVFEEAGWTVRDYRALPVSRPGGPPRSSRSIVDGVIHLAARVSADETP